MTSDTTKRQGPFFKGNSIAARAHFLAERPIPKETGLTKASRPSVPVNIITGSLGVGKTATSNPLLERRPQGET